MHEYNVFGKLLCCFAMFILTMRIVEQTKGALLRNNSHDDRGMLKELPGVISSDVRVSSSNSRKYFLSDMICF